MVRTTVASRVTALRVAAWVTALAVAVLAPAAARACSFAPFASVRAPRVVHFVGTAEPDTVATGPGDVRYDVNVVSLGGAARTSFYGQMVTLERIGASAAPAVQRAVAGGARRVVLVPWSYGPDCAPRSWPASMSTRWVAPGTRGLFTGVLREPAQWVAPDVPTLDVHQVEMEPYPLAYERLQREAHAYGGGQADTTALTAEQMLLFYDHLPDVDRLAAEPVAATDPLRRWAQDHPDLAARRPAAEIIYAALVQAEGARVRAIRSPLAGTYRFALRFPRGDSLVFFARTAVRPTSTLDRVSDSDPQLWEQRGPPHVPGYYVDARVARTLAQLPDRRASEPPHDSGWRSQGYVAVVEAPIVATRDSTVWRGGVDLLEQAARLAPAGSSLRAQVDAARAAAWRLLERGELSYAPGRFVMRAGGAVRYELTVREGDTPVVTVRGTRVSLDHLAER